MTINVQVFAEGIAYDAMGRPWLYTSYSASSQIVNQVKDIYDGFGNLVKEYQSTTGRVNLNTTPCVQYTYSDPATTGGKNRLTSIIYPNGRVLNYNYNHGL